MIKMDAQMLAQIADSVSTPDSPGYTAEYHGLVDKAVVVWAPCGCQLVVGSAGGSLLTNCRKDTCDFSWQEALNAISTLENATKEAPGATTALQIVPKEPADGV